MKTEPLWKIEKRHMRPGRYLNSPTAMKWCECGLIRAQNRGQAFSKAWYAVGSSEVRVSRVSEFYRPIVLE
jgi:hypothetical protein